MNFFYILKKHADYSQVGSGESAVYRRIDFADRTHYSAVMYDGKTYSLTLANNGYQNGGDGPYDGNTMNDVAPEKIISLLSNGDQAVNTSLKNWVACDAASVERHESRKTRVSFKTEKYRINRRRIQQTFGNRQIHIYKPWSHFDGRSIRHPQKIKKLGEMPQEYISEPPWLLEISHIHNSLQSLN